MITYTVGKALIASLFIITGIMPFIMGLGDMTAMVKPKVPKNFIPGVDPKTLTIIILITKIVLGFMLLFGIQTKAVSILLILFTILTTVLYHNVLQDKTQSLHMMKNVAIIGGLMLLL